MDPADPELPRGNQPVMDKLSEEQITTQLPEARGWERIGDMLVQCWQFATARRALEFVQQVAATAERLEHYPEICLRFREVKVELATHEVGGLSARDFELAAAINTIPADR